MQNLFSFSVPHFLCTLVTPHQSHSRTEWDSFFFFPVFCQFPLDSNSSFLMFLNFSHTCRPSAVCDSHGVMYLDFGCWFPSCVYTVLKLLRFFCLWFLFCLSSVFTFISIFLKKKWHLTLIYVGLKNPNDPTDPEPREDGAETKPKWRHRFEMVQSRSACLDQQNLGRWLGLPCLNGVVWTDFAKLTQNTQYSHHCVYEKSWISGRGRMLKLVLEDYAGIYFSSKQAYLQLSNWLLW